MYTEYFMLEIGVNNLINKVEDLKTEIAVLKISAKSNKHDFNREVDKLKQRLFKIENK